MHDPFVIDPSVLWYCQSALPWRRGWKSGALQPWVGTEGGGILREPLQFRRTVHAQDWTPPPDNAGRDTVFCISAKCWLTISQTGSRTRTITNRLLHLEQWCTNPGCQVDVATTFCASAPSVCGSSVRNLLYVTLQAPRFLRLLLHFWKIYAPLT